MKKAFCPTNPFSSSKNRRPIFANDFETSSFKEALEDYLKVFENGGRIRAIMYRFNECGQQLSFNIQNRFKCEVSRERGSETTLRFEYKGNSIYVHIAEQDRSNSLFAICFSC